MLRSGVCPTPAPTPPAARFADQEEAARAFDHASYLLRRDKAITKWVQACKEICLCSAACVTSGQAHVAPHECCCLSSPSQPHAPGRAPCQRLGMLF